MTNLDIYCIAYGCPKKDREKDCPFAEIVHLSFKQKIEWIDKLDDLKKEAIIKHHMNCTYSI